MRRATSSSLVSLWAALLVAYAVLLHGPATAAASADLLGCPAVGADHADDNATDALAHQLDPGGLGDTCRALCASSVSKVAILPATGAVAPQTGGRAAPPAGPVVWLGAGIGSWAEVRGPPAGWTRLTLG